MKATTNFKLSYSINGKIIYVNTDHNGYMIVNDQDKGTAIYQDLDSGNVLIKSYSKESTLTAINYLLQKEFLEEAKKIKGEKYRQATNPQPSPTKD